MQTRIGKLIVIVISILAMIGCDSGEIDNFEDIQIEADYRTGRIDIWVYLLDQNGNPLIWNDSIVTPGIGSNALHVSKITTEVEIYSMKENQPNALIYHDKLYELRWSSSIGSSVRLLIGEIPNGLIREDPQRDTELGQIKVTVETEKQGPFSDTLVATRVYSR